VDNSITPNGRAYKLRPLFESLQNSLKEHAGLEEYMSIGESTIPYLDNHLNRQFTQGNPIKFGFKMWALCSKGGIVGSI